MCGWAAIFLFCMWLIIGRCAEQNTLRTYERTMMDEYISDTLANFSFWTNPVGFVWSHCQRLLDYVCPIFLQKLFWKRRTRYDDINQYIIGRRGNDGREYRSVMNAVACQERGDRTMNSKPSLSSTSKALVCVIVLGFSFTTCTPSYSLNLCIVFFSSIALVRSHVMGSFFYACC